MKPAGDARLPVNKILLASFARRAPSSPPCFISSAGFQKNAKRRRARTSCADFFAGVSALAQPGLPPKMNRADSKQARLQLRVRLTSKKLTKISSREIGENFSVGNSTTQISRIIRFNWRGERGVRVYNRAIRRAFFARPFPLPGQPSYSVGVKNFRTSPPRDDASFLLKNSRGRRLQRRSSTFARERSHFYETRKRPADEGEDDAAERNGWLSGRTIVRRPSSLYWQSLGNPPGDARDYRGGERLSGSYFVTRSPVSSARYS